MQDQRTHYHEPPEFSVERGLRERGYFTGGIHKDQDEIGILRSQEPAERRFLWFRWYSRRAALVVGNLVLDGSVDIRGNPDFGINSEKRVRRDKRWVLEIYGRDYSRELVGVIDKISEPYGVEVYAVLADESPHESWMMSE